MLDVTFDTYRPGALAGLVGLHMAYYAENWGFGQAFEVKLATESAAFLRDFNPARDLFRTAWRGDKMLACIAIDGSEKDGEGNHLRWFIVSDAARGTGLGARLITDALNFCDASPCPSTWLTTFAGLDAAAALYARVGFRLVGEQDDDQWQGGVREQRYERSRPDIQQDL